MATNPSGRTVRDRQMSSAGLQSVVTQADLQDLDGRQSTATQKLGNTTTPSSVKDEHKAGGHADHDADTPPLSMHEMYERIEQQARQIAALTANTLPSPASINAAASSNVVRPSGTMGAALRLQSTAPAKNSVASRVVTITPAAEEKSVIAGPATPAANTFGGDTYDDSELADIGVDGKQDEPTAAEQAAVLAGRLAEVQCSFVDEEHDESFVKWFKSCVWKESFKREARLMCTLADTMRGEFAANVIASDSFEMICCRIAALQCMNEGDGSAVADIIEGKHHKSMVPQTVRLAAIKQANMVSRTKSVINKGSNNDKKKVKKTKNYSVTKNTGGHYAGKAGGTTGVKK
jgi:hypothetical protein